MEFGRISWWFNDGFIEIEWNLVGFHGDLKDVDGV